MSSPKLAIILITNSSLRALAVESECHDFKLHPSFDMLCGLKQVTSVSGLQFPCASMGKGETEDLQGPQQTWQPARLQVPQSSPVLILSRSFKAEHSFESSLPSKPHFGHISAPAIPNSSWLPNTAARHPHQPWDKQYVA